MAGGEHHGFPRILQERRRETEIKREVGKERGWGGGRERQRKEKEVTVFLRKHIMFLYFLGNFSVLKLDTLNTHKVQFGSVQSRSCFRLFPTAWTAACQASLSITISRSLLKLMPIESVMPSNHLILCCPLLLT